MAQSREQMVLPLGGGDTAFGSEEEEVCMTCEEGRCALSSVPLGTLFLPDKPRLEESGCPGNQTWMEGMEQMLVCVPEGNPTPSLVCTWKGMMFDLEVPQKATQNHTGTYCCTATNQLGSVSKDIALIVQGDCGAQDGIPQGPGFLSKHGKKKDFSGLGRMRPRSGLGGLGQGDSLALEPSQFSVFCVWAGLDEGIGSTVFIIIIVALGAGIITIALYLNYRPCKIEKRKLPYRQKEKNKEEESQFAVQQAEKCTTHSC